MVRWVISRIEENNWSISSRVRIRRISEGVRGRGDVLGMGTVIIISDFLGFDGVSLLGEVESDGRRSRRRRAIVDTIGVVFDGTGRGCRGVDYAIALFCLGFA